MSKKPKKFKHNYFTLGVLAKPYGISAIKLGKLLSQAGLRGPDGAPTATTLADEVAKPTPLKDGKPFWMWHKRKVNRALTLAGLFPRRPSEAQLLLYELEKDYKACKRLDDGTSTGEIVWATFRRNWAVRLIALPAILKPVVTHRLLDRSEERRV